MPVPPDHVMDEQQAFRYEHHRAKGVHDLSDLNGDESAASILQSVKEQEAQFEQLTRELEAERQSVANQLERCKLGSETASMSSISSTDDSFHWRPPAHDSRFDEESDADSRVSGSQLVDSCLKVLQDRGLMNVGEDPREHLPEDPANPHTSGHKTSHHVVTVTNVISTKEVHRPDKTGSQSSLPGQHYPSNNNHVGYPSDLGPPPLHSPAGSQREIAPLPPPTRLPPNYDPRYGNGGDSPYSGYNGSSPSSAAAAMHESRLPPPGHLTSSLPRNEHDYDSFDQQFPYNDSRYPNGPVGHDPSFQYPSHQDSLDYGDGGSSSSFRPGDDKIYLTSALPGAPPSEDSYRSEQLQQQPPPPLHQGSYPSLAAPPPGQHPVYAHDRPPSDDGRYGSDSRFSDRPDVGHLDDRYPLGPAVASRPLDSPRSDHYTGSQHLDEPQRYPSIQDDHFLGNSSAPGQPSPAPSMERPGSQQPPYGSKSHLPPLRDDQPSPRPSYSNPLYDDARPPFFEQPAYPDELGVPQDQPTLGAFDPNDPSRRSPSLDSLSRDQRWRNPDLQEVIEFLRHPTPSIKANAAAYLQHLCYMDDQTKAKTRSLGGIPALVELVNNEIPEVHRAACGALRNLSYGRTNEENKKAIKNAGGITALVRLLRKSPDNDVRELVTGILWNLSSCKDLKKPVIDEGLTVIVDFVIVPHSGWSRSNPPENPPQEVYWSTVFRNGSGILRNVSSDEGYARRKLRECDGLVDAIVHIVRAAIGKSDIDNKSVENCVCVLRNLSYACQEVDDATYLNKRAQQQKPGNNKGESPGCFGGSSSKKKDSKKDKKDSKKDLKKDGHHNSSSSVAVVPEYGMHLLWHPKIVHIYLPLLYDCTNPETLEAAAGAIQNLAACEWPASAAIREAVRREKGLPVLVELLNLEADRVVCAAATALRNLAFDPSSNELIGKYAMHQLVVRLPQKDHSAAVSSDDTLAALEALIYEVIKSHLEFAESFLKEGGVDRLLYMVRAEGLNYKVRKYASSILQKMWEFKDLHSNYRDLNYKEQDFLTKPLDPRRTGAAKSPPSSADNTLNRPRMDQSGPTMAGYNEHTLPPINRQHDPKAPNYSGGGYMAESNNVQAREPYGEEVAMTQLGPLPQALPDGSPGSGYYSTIDRRPEDRSQQQQPQQPEYNPRPPSEQDRASDYNRPVSYDTQQPLPPPSSNYDRGPAEYDRDPPDYRTGDYDGDVADYPRGPADYDRGPADYDRGPGDYDRAPADYERGPADYERTYPGEYSPSDRGGENTYDQRPNDYRPPGGVPLFPNLPPGSTLPPPQQQQQDSSREPLYARVSKKQGNVQLEGVSPSGGPGGADSWV